MFNEISFPNFGFMAGKAFRIGSDVFSIGNYTMKWYGLIIAIGFALACLYVFKRAPQFGSTADQFADLLLWELPLCIIGARVYYVLNTWGFYSQNPEKIYRIWEGGLAIYGAVITAFLVAYIYSRFKPLDLLSVLDLGSIGLLIGQILGRWGNFTNAEAYGGETSLPWGMSINGGASVHPTFLYESLWNLIGLIGLHYYSKHRKFRGEIWLLYIAWYGLGRVWIEGLRSDSLYLGNTGIRISQLLAGLSFLTAAGVLIYCRIAKKYRPLDTAPKAESEGKELGE